MRGGSRSSSRSLDNFQSAINSPFTEKTYTNSIKLFKEFCKVESYDSLLDLDNDTTFENIKDFIIFQRKKKNRSLQRIHVLFSAIRLFYSINRYDDLNWYTLARYKGRESSQVTRDRIYTKDEIQLLLNHASLRMKVVILLMLSSGMRVGAVTDLRLYDLVYREKEMFYQITVYSNSPKYQYYTFCTPECTHYINLYLEYRQRKGERLTPESKLIVNSMDSNEISAKSILQVLFRLLLKSGIRQKKPIHNEETRRQRTSIMCSHGFRKYFNTVCIESDMNIVSKELLMGHKKSLGLERSYYRPSSDKLLNEYIKVVNDLTINDEHRLRIKVKQQEKEIEENKKEFANIYKMIQELKSKESS